MFRKEISLCIVFLTSYFSVILGTITILDKGVKPLVKGSIGIQFYVNVENKNRGSVCKISPRGKICLVDDNRKDCSFETSSAYSNFVKSKQNKTLIFVFPTLFQHDLIGYLDLTLEYQCRNKRNITDLRIPFNTKVSSNRMQSNYLLRHYIENEKYKECMELDQNSLNDCNSVDCDIKYLGKRSYFNEQLQKCTPVTTCIGDPEKELPEAALVLSSNTCRDLDSPLTVQDIYAIRTGLGTAVLSTTAAPTNEIKLDISSNCSTISQNIKFLRDLTTGKFYPSNDGTLDVSAYCRSAFFSIVISVMIFCFSILLFAFLLNTINCICTKDKDRSRCWKKLKSTLNVFESESVHEYGENKEVRNSLIREIMIRDLPMELRNSAVDICQTMKEEINRKNRYRMMDVGSQISLVVDNNYQSTSASLSTTSIEANDKKNRLP
ncbi:uncharacterized protein [Battus philenor]|uniref:uncharacterized protein n=1 Tax=Battus philenor TaxID=42288 RepID=UPI0035D06BEF